MTLNSDNFSESKSRTIIKDQALENGFLLVETIIQNRDVLNWVNSNKIINSYLPTGVEQSGGAIKSNQLSANHPSLFNPITKIQFSILQASQFQIKVYDVLGNKIETLVNEEKPSGTYELYWNATNLPSGVYFYRIQAGPSIDTKKMILLK